MLVQGQQAVRKRLIEVARSRGTTYYSDIAPLVPLDLSSEVGRIQIAQLLDNISSTEHAAGRPLLSAVVISLDANRPGDGFFKLAERKDLYHGGTDEQARDTFWLGEVHRVWATWTDNRD